MSFQFVEDGEDKSNTAVQIEEDGPSETFKDEESKVNCITLCLNDFYIFPFPTCLTQFDVFVLVINNSVQYTRR